MFALEITFSDGPTEVETILLRRHRAMIGASSSAHVEIQDMQGLNYDLRLTRDVSGKFRVAPISKTNNAALSNILEGVYDRVGHFDLGKVKLNIVALDSDLALKESEPADRAGARVMRLANSNPSPAFPALVVQGADPYVVSFTPDSPVYVGSAKGSTLRLDGAEVSPKHARIGYESGEFWVEDLGSSQGTFVEGTQISGRVSVKSGSPISISKAVSIVGVAGNEQLQAAISTVPGKVKGPQAEERRYPVLVSISEVVRPARLVMPIDGTVVIGRDPQCDMWFGAPHVSRKHCAFALSKTGLVAISDYSKNGTLYDQGILKKGDLVQIKDRAHVFDFGGGITLALCFNQEQEKKFIESAGSPHTFVEADKNDITAAGHYGEGKPQLFVRHSATRRRAKNGSKVIEFISTFVLFYQSLSLRSKIALYITAASVIIVLVVLLNLILRLNF